MRAYYAIIKDAFREAFASRTLWILLILISLFLVGLLPLSYNETLSSGLSLGDVKDWTRLMGRMLSEDTSENQTPGKHILSQLDNEQVVNSLRALRPNDNEDASREKNGETNKEDGNPNVDPAGEQETGDDADSNEAATADETIESGELLRPGELMFHMNMALQNAMNKDSFYDENSWKSKRMREEVNDLLAQESLSEEEIKYRNRLLLEEAYPDLITPVPPRSFQMTYLGYELPGKFAMRRSDFLERIQSIVLFCLLFLFGSAGILIAIMVTAPIIPQTFDPGSLSLLLSKPISRSLMFISQYFGGLAFIGILAFYTFGGLCLIIGFRLGYWNVKLMYYIPCFVFIFAVYYAVSCLVGLIWRNTSLSIILTIVFWICCATIGLTKFVCDLALSQMEAKGLIAVEGEIFVMRKLPDVQVWDEQENDWSPAYFGGAGGQRMFVHGPIFDRKRNRLISQDATFGSGPMPVSMNPEIRFAAPDDNWKKHVGSQLPVGVLDIQPHPEEGFIVFSVSGFHRFKGRMEIPDKEATTAKKPKQQKRIGGPRGFMNLFAKKDAVSADDFQQIGPDRHYVLSPWASAVNQSNGDIAVYSRGIIAVFTQTHELYELVERRELDGDSGQKAAIGFGEDTILLSREDDGIIVLDSKTLEEKDRQRVEGNSVVKSIEFNRKGDLAAIILQNQKLLIFDANQQTFSRPGLTSQDNVFGATFNSQDQLAYCDRWLTVRLVDTDEMKVVESVKAKTTGFNWFYRYILTPVHTIFPKPGSLNNTAQYLVTGDDTREDYNLSLIRLVPVGNLAETLKNRYPRVYLNPWPPVWNGLIFISVVLAIGCIYIERQQY